MNRYRFGGIWVLFAGLYEKPDEGIATNYETVISVKIDLSH